MNYARVKNNSMTIKLFRATICTLNKKKKKKKKFVATTLNFLNAINSCGNVIKPESSFGQ